MKIIAQKSNILNTRDFFYNSLMTDYIDAIGFNITYTKDQKLVIFNTMPSGSAVTDTINTSTYSELEGYEILLLEEALDQLSKSSIKKELYINLTPFDLGILSDENIKEITTSLNRYVDNLKNLLDTYPELTYHLHSINRNLVTLLAEKIKTSEIGFVVAGNDFNFIDVDYYILMANTQNDAIVNMLLEAKKRIIIYVTSDYHLSYLYRHYLGETSTPYLQETFKKLDFMTNYPEIIHKVFET